MAEKTNKWNTITQNIDTKRNQNLCSREKNLSYPLLIWDLLRLCQVWWGWVSRAGTPWSGVTSPGSLTRLSSGLIVQRTTSWLISGAGWEQSGSWEAPGSCRSWWWWRGARCWWTEVWTCGSMQSTFGGSSGSTRGRRGCWSTTSLEATWERSPGLWKGSDEMSRGSNEFSLKWN